MTIYSSPFVAFVTGYVPSFVAPCRGWTCPAARAVHLRHGVKKLSMMNMQESGHEEDAVTSATNTSESEFDEFASFVYDKQREICEALERMEWDTAGPEGKATQAVFSTDDWVNESGKGRTRVLQYGNVFEKAGVNVSVLSGILSKERAQAITARTGGKNTLSEGDDFKAASLSMVLHTQSPLIPTLRADVRLFHDVRTCDTFGGGGCDLTPYYVDSASFTTFHQSWRSLLPDHYNEFKSACDAYFYIPIRRERRGVGGIFYDDLQVPDLVRFQKAVASHFVPSFDPVVRKWKDVAYSEEQKEWQRIRRGRYLEFNFLNDRGVKFGLSKQMSTQRFESVMISAPPSVSFPYNLRLAPGSPEEDVVHMLSNEPVDWAEEPV